MAQFGWRPAFLIFGVISALWLIPWWRATRHLDLAAGAALSAPSPSYLQIMKRMSV